MRNVQPGNATNGVFADEQSDPAILDESQLFPNRIVEEYGAK